MEQIFFNESCRFYTRTTRSGKSQLLYCHINIADSRYVIGTGVKVKPEQYNVKKQLAIISNELTELDNRNNKVVNDVIKDLHGKYINLVNYLENNPDYIAEVENILPNFVPMKRKGKQTNNSAPKAKKTLYDTLEYIFTKQLEYEEDKKIINKQRKEVKLSQLRPFYIFLNDKGYNDVWATITPSIYNEYTDYLTNEKRTAKNEKLNITYINNLLSVLKNIVNKVIERDTENKYTPVDTSKWHLLKKVITTSEKKTANYLFSDEQLKAIINLKLDGNAEVVRDLFVYMCYVGQRPADCVRLLKGEGKRFVSNGIEVISLIPHKTRKTDKRANVPLFNVEAVDAIIAKFQTKPLHIEYLNKTDALRNSLNGKWIKKIFAMAGINDTYDKISQNGTDIKETKQNQAHTAHLYLARHYFITNMCKHGLSADEVIEMTGHSTSQQIRETYAHLTAEDEANTITSNAIVQRLAGKTVPVSRMANNTPQTNEFDGLIKEIKMYKLGFYDKVSNAVKTKVKETAIFNNCSLERACDILLSNLE